MRHLDEEQLIIHYYGESEAAADVEQHLGSCAACRTHFQALQQVLGVVDDLSVPERDQNYGAEVWQRLRPKLYEQPSASLAWLRLPRWAMVGVAALLVVGAFLIGRYWRQMQIPEQGPIPAQVRNRILLAAVADHLDRLQRVLSELANAEADGSVEISGEQRSARDLLVTNRIFRISSARNGELVLAAVLEEFEPILLEIEHAPSRLSAAELQQIRQRVDSQDLLFKIRVLSLQARQRQRSPTGDLGRTT